MERTFTAAQKMDTWRYAVLLGNEADGCSFGMPRSGVSDSDVLESGFIAETAVDTLSYDYRRSPDDHQHFTAKGPVSDCCFILVLHGQHQRTDAGYLPSARQNGLERKRI